MRRSAGEWAGIVAEYEKSGRTRTMFCEERSLSVKSLEYHLRQRRRALGTRPCLVPVELVSSPASESTLRVELANGRRIAVQVGFDAELLRRVVAVLER